MTDSADVGRESCRNLPTNKACLNGDREVFKVHLQGISCNSLGRFGVFGNLQAWTLHLCVQRILLVQADLFSLLRQEVLIPRSDKFVAALFRDRQKGLDIDLTVVYHLGELCKCGRLLRGTTWRSLDFPPQGLAICECGRTIDRCRACRAWVYMVTSLSQSKGLRLVRHLDPVDQRSLTTSVEFGLGHFNYRVRSLKHATSEKAG